MRWVATRRIDRSLDFYLALGLHVASTTDGWALLRADIDKIATDDIILEHRPQPRITAALVLHVHTTGLEALHRQMTKAGVPVAPESTRPAHRAAASPPPIPTETSC